jgi:DNA-binding NtrC family response regulator
MLARPAMQDVFRLIQRLAPHARVVLIEGETGTGKALAPLGDLEREHILNVLRQVRGNRMAAAKVLGISRRALYRRIERHGLTDEAPRGRLSRRL